MVYNKDRVSLLLDQRTLLTSLPATPVFQTLALKYSWSRTCESRAVKYKVSVTKFSTHKRCRM